MIITTHGMHVRAIGQLDEQAGTCVAFGFGSPEQRLVPHPLKLVDLKADGGMNEIRRVALRGCESL